MAKNLSKAGISTNQTVEAWHVTQSIDAFSGTEAYNIILSGSSIITGSLDISGSLSIQPPQNNTGTNVLTIDSNGQIFKTGSYSSGGGITPTLQAVTNQGSITTTPITASIISSSKLQTSDLEIHGTSSLRRGNATNILYVGNNANWEGIEYGRNILTPQRFNSNITASYNISASGYISASSIEIPGPIINNLTSSYAITASYALNGSSGGSAAGTNGMVQLSDGAGGFKTSNNSQFYYDNTGGFVVGDGYGTYFISQSIVGGMCLTLGDATNITPAERKIVIPNDFGSEPIEITGSLDVSGSLSIQGITDVSASIASAGGGSAAGTNGMVQLSDGTGGFKTSQNSQFYYDSNSGGLVVGDGYGLYYISQSIDGGGIFLTLGDATNAYSSNIIKIPNGSSPGPIEITGSLSVLNETSVFYSTNGFNVYNAQLITLGTLGSTIEIDLNADDIKLDFNGVTPSVGDVLVAKDTSGKTKWTGSSAIGGGGTTVTANPGSSGGGGLTTIGIGGTNYSIAEGGGPIETHTSNFTSSAAFNGKYNIVGGNLAISVQTGSNDLNSAMEWNFFQTSSGDTFEFTPGTGVTLISKNNHKKLASQGSAATLKYISDQTFHLVGDLTL